MATSKNGIGVSYLGNLPEELLERIIELTSFPQDVSDHWCECQRHARHFEDLVSLSLVSRQLHRITTPLLYNHLYANRIAYRHWDHSMVRGMMPNKKLHRTLMETPSLRQHCRTLRACVQNHTESGANIGWSIPVDIASWLSEVRCLKVYGTADPADGKHTGPFLDAASTYMQFVKHLRINHDTSAGFLLRDVYNHVKFPLLESLELSGIWLPLEAASCSLPPEQHRTAPFTRLHLDYYNYNLESTASLLQWPKTLRHFSVRLAGGGGMAWMTPARIGRLLAVHKDTLETLESHATSSSQTDKLDVTGFSKLRSLTLTSASFGPLMLFNSEEVRKLLAPNIEVLGINLCQNSTYGDRWNAFGDREETWLQQFAAFAAKEKPSLRRIRILFTPAYVKHCGRLHGYPWDRMDKLGKHIRRFGIELEYNTPVLSRRAWLERIEQTNPSWVDKFWGPKPKDRATVQKP